MSVTTFRRALGVEAGEEPLKRTARRYRWAGETMVVWLAVAAGIALRLFVQSDLWTDEVLSVNISRLPVGQLIDALGHDGHPPLYYLLLHWWMSVFGESDLAVRSLSMALSVAVLPFIKRVGEQIGGRTCGIAAVVLMATSPQMVRYGTETRMYALLVLIVTLSWLALRAALRQPSWASLLSVTLGTAALLYTHYWSVYLLAALVCVLAWTSWRGRPRSRGPARRALAAVCAGGLLFVPWLPVFVEQIQSTGTPWAAPARPAQVLFSLLVGDQPSGEASLLGLALAALIVLAVFARPTGPRRVELEIPGNREVRAESLLLVLSLTFGVVGGYATAVAFAPRYTAVVFPILAVLASAGITKLPTRPAKIGALAIVAVLGLTSCLKVTLDNRTQLGDIGRLLRAKATSGDVVLECPDQLAPGVLRYADKPLQHVTFPPTARPERIDWIDYRYRVSQTDPAAYARLVSAEAGGRPVWVVWSENYSLLDRSCEKLLSSMGDIRPANEIIVTSNEGEESAWLYRFDPP